MLSAEQLRQLDKWQKDPDPLNRLTTDYYKMRRHQIKRDYEKLLDSATDPDDVATARDLLLSNLTRLEKQYNDDIRLSCTLHLMNNNIPAVELLHIPVHTA
jgi:hypothetical protein